MYIFAIDIALLEALPSTASQRLFCARLFYRAHSSSTKVYSYIGALNRGLFYTIRLQWALR